MEKIIYTRDYFNGVSFTYFVRVIREKFIESKKSIAVTVLLFWGKGGAFKRRSWKLSRRLSRELSVEWAI